MNVLKKFTYILAICLILFGCSTPSIKDKALAHDTEYISDTIIELYQQEKYEKCANFCDETYKAYHEILNDLLENGANEDFAPYAQDLKSIKACYQLVISQYDSFVEDINVLISGFEAFN